MGKAFTKPHSLSGGTHVVIVGWTGHERYKDVWEHCAALDIVTRSGSDRIYLSNMPGTKGSDRFIGHHAMRIAESIAERAWAAVRLNKNTAVPIPPLSPGLLCRSWLGTGDERGTTHNQPNSLYSKHDGRRWAYDRAPHLALTVGPGGTNDVNGHWPHMWVIQDGKVIRRTVIDLEPTER